MTESGGAATQDGIFYQNSVAALYLADLLDLQPAPPRERVTGVRVEAPQAVDDIVVDHADAHRHALTAKLSLRAGTKAWTAMWADLAAQVAVAWSRPNDRFTIVVEKRNAAAELVEALCTRAATSVDLAELLGRLTTAQRAALPTIGLAAMDNAARFELLRRIDLLVLSWADIDHQFALRRSQASTAPPATFFALLRDQAGGHARKRQQFRAPDLRRRLAQDHDIIIVEPPDWGVDAYRAAIQRDARIEIPGTGLSGPAPEVILWPLVRDWERGGRPDFEDELPPDRIDLGEAVIDLRNFPSSDLHRCVLVAGPGHGKSALLMAIAANLATGESLPAQVPLASLAASGATVADFLNDHLNRAFDVRIDWRRMAEQGLVALLLDGLDEVPGPARAPLLERLRTFSARYPDVPWLLTVRDPAVLTGANDARTLEILPLGDHDIARFAKVMAAHGLTVDGDELVDRLRSHPDLQRLARIPLFLALMLATLDPAGGLPSSRADLIERYLKTLFAPHEHKAVGGAPLSPIQLRAIAERLAFERLEAGEIGASEREIAAVVSSIVAPGEADRYVAGLAENGIVRRQSTIRFQFPFPIVQEYLAATHLVATAPDSVAARIDDAIQRPWAQVLQFALELHPAPSPIMREMLARPEDAFATGLRLVARCIANGAHADAGVRAEVGERLVRFWRSAHSNARDRVGQLIVDSFSTPIFPALRAALRHRWLVHDGAAEIIVREKDPELTLEVLEAMLARPIDEHSFYFPMKPAFTAIADAAFDRILEVARSGDLTDEEWSGVNDLLNHLATGSVARDKPIAVLADPAIPIEVRLTCARIAGPPFSDAVWALIAESISLGDLRPWRTTTILAEADNRDDRLFALLADESIKRENRLELARYFTRVFEAPAERDAMIARVTAAEALDPEIRLIARLYAARHGNRAEFEALIATIPTIPESIVSQLISLFGHYSDRALSDQAVALVEQRALTPEEVTRFSHAAHMGMRYVYEMDAGFGGSLHDAPPHSGSGLWSETLERWSERTDLSDTRRMDIVLRAAKLGAPSAKTRLIAMVLAIEDPDDSRYDEGDQLGQGMREAVSEVRRWHGQIPLDLARRLTRASRANVPYAGIAAIGAHGTREALDLLLNLHNEQGDWHHRSTLAGEIETLAGKLGVFIQRDGASLTLIDQ